MTCRSNRPGRSSACRADLCLPRGRHYGVNGRRLTVTNNAAYDLIMAVAAGHLDSVEDIAPVLEKATQPRGSRGPGGK